MFRRVLIANRGEIALRIARACGGLGVETVQVFSEADRDAPWLRAADRAICIGGPRPRQSYLNAEAILQAAEQSGCQAIHPGYGFLAENAVFAARCREQGLTFIGPSAESIRRMGDKATAKRTLAERGLPTIPGSTGALRDVDEARRVAREVGYPVLLKACAGGGGKGMRLCEDEAGLPQAFREAALEAESAFSNSELYLEKFIQSGRHVEFQVLCDAYGNGIHLGERECSIQRKHQKLLEESPSPAIDPGVRESLGRRVARVVASTGYVNAGTVEFLRTGEGELFFMEMNTRLQVEHPVTEMVTGIDLVEQQLRIAANQPLSIEQRSVRLQGHAIELRINAEDPDRDFQPDPGTIRAFTPPAASLAGCRVRWDSAIETGYRVPPYYDSLLGKLIVHAVDRSQALQGAQEALERMTIEGPATTIGLHRALLCDPGVRSGRYDVETLERRELRGAADEG